MIDGQNVGGAISKSAPRAASTLLRLLLFTLVPPGSSSNFPGFEELEMLMGKVAVITGAAKGIGLATARLMLRHRAKARDVSLSLQTEQGQLPTQVCLADLKETVDVAELQREFGRNAVFISTDVTDSVQLVASETMSHNRSCSVLLLCRGGCFRRQ